MGATLIRGRSSACARGRGHRAAQLGERERDVVRLLSLGHTCVEVAAQVGRSPRTIEAYRARIMEKLGLETRADLVQYALSEGLLEQPVSAAAPRNLSFLAKLLFARALRGRCSGRDLIRSGRRPRPGRARLDVERLRRLPHVQERGLERDRGAEPRPMARARRAPREAHTRASHPAPCVRGWSRDARVRIRALGAGARRPRFVRDRRGLRLPPGTPAPLAPLARRRPSSPRPPRRSSAGWRASGSARSPRKGQRYSRRRAASAATRTSAPGSAGAGPPTSRGSGATPAASPRLPPTWRGPTGGGTT